MENRQYEQTLNISYIQKCYEKLYAKYKNWDKILTTSGIDENITKNLYLRQKETNHYEPHIHYNPSRLNIKFYLLKALEPKFNNDFFHIVYNATDFTEVKIKKLAKKLYKALHKNSELTKYLVILYYNKNTDVYVQIKDKKILSLIREICNSK